MKLWKLAPIVGVFVAGAANAASTIVVVPGSANPYLAGQPAGTSCCGADSAPAQSPPIVTGLVGGATLTFSATGGVNHAGGTPGDSADGEHSDAAYTYLFSMPGDYGTGIAGPQYVNVDGLVGVFLDDTTPAGTPPAGLAYASDPYNAGGLQDASYSPGLAQIFWIGDGLTGIGTGATQQFIVPTGATRLFLGTVDGSGWQNNSGAITVTVNGLAGAPAAVPEPASWALMIGGFGMVGGAIRRRRAVRLHAAFA